MDDKIIPLYPRLGRPEPQLPAFTPRDLATARKQREEARALNRRRKPLPPWSTFLMGFLANELLHLLRQLHT
jgi:hypothetical protein